MRYRFLVGCLAEQGIQLKTTFHSSAKRYKAHQWFHSIFSLLNLGWRPKDNYGNNKAERFSKRLYGFDRYDAQWQL